MIAMSYEKAMRHHRNRRKGRRMYLGFDTSEPGEPPLTPISDKLHRLIEIHRWFHDRRNGDKQYKRECIREAIKTVRRFYPKAPQAQT